MGDNWDDEDFEPAIVVPGPAVNKWEGEDEDDDVKDSWDAEDDDEEKSAGGGGEAGASTATGKKKRRKLEEIIAEKEAKKAEEHRRRQEELKKAQADDPEKDPLQKKMEELRMQEEADLELAKATFGGDDSARARSGTPLSTGPLDSKEDFEAFRQQIASRLEPASVAISPHFIPFVEDVLRDMVSVIGDIDDLKRVSGTLSALYNEKLKASKASKGKKSKGKGAKVSIKTEKQEAMQDYGGLDDEYDDFM